jgi:hypothetical protein
MLTRPRWRVNHPRSQPRRRPQIFVVEGRRHPIDLAGGETARRSAISADRTARSAPGCEVGNEPPRERRVRRDPTRPVHVEHWGPAALPGAGRMLTPWLVLAGAGADV